MLRPKTITKREKKEKSRKKFGFMLILIGLFIIASLLFYVVFLQKKPPLISPLAKDQISSSSKIQSALSEKKIIYISLETTKELDYIIKLDKSSEVIIDPKKDIGPQLSSLQLILSQLKIEGKTFKRLDFRYQKPIISF